VFAVSRICDNPPNLFCYVCGEFALKSKKKFITPIVKQAYELYFGCTFGIKRRAGHHIFAIFTWLAHWQSPINDFSSSFAWVRTE